MGDWGNFIERFLLPKLSSINRLMTLEIYSVEAALDTGLPYLAYNYAVGGNFGIGKGNPTEDRTTFSMSQQVDNPCVEAWRHEARVHLTDILGSPGDGATVWRYRKFNQVMLDSRLTR